MLPNEQTSENIGPVWKPQVWSTGPDQLVSDARNQLFMDARDLNEGVLGGTDRAMSGGGTGYQNESDVLIGKGLSEDGGDGAAGMGRAQRWRAIMDDMRKDEPLAAWSSGTHDGSANPAP